MAANFIGLEQEITALGKTWKLARFTMGLMRPWLEWAKPQLRDPLARAHKHVEYLTARTIQIEKEHAGPECAQLRDRLLKACNDEMEHVVNKAREEDGAHLSLDAPHVKALFTSIDGLAYLFYLLLKPAHPEMTRELAAQIVDDLGQDAAMQKVKTAEGVTPANPPAAA